MTTLEELLLDAVESAEWLPEGIYLPLMNLCKEHRDMKEHLDMVKHLIRVYDTERHNMYIKLKESRRKTKQLEHLVDRLTTCSPSSNTRSFKRKRCV